MCPLRSACLASKAEPRAAAGSLAYAESVYECESPRALESKISPNKRRNGRREFTAELARSRCTAHVDFSLSIQVHAVPSERVTPSYWLTSLLTLELSSQDHEPFGGFGFPGPGIKSELVETLTSMSCEGQKFLRGSGSTHCQLLQVSLLLPLRGRVHNSGLRKRRAPNQKRGKGTWSWPRKAPRRCPRG